MGTTCGRPRRRGASRRRSTIIDDPSLQQTTRLGGALLGCKQMISAFRRAFCIRLVAVGSTLAAATAAAVAPQGQRPDAHAVARSGDLKGSFGKSETITGALSGVDPIKGIILLTRRGPHEPPSVQLSWTESGSSGTGGHTQRSPISVSQGPGETTYDFKVTGSTLIRVNGTDASLGSLAKFPNARAAVRFTPRRDGNFALEITVSH